MRDEEFKRLSRMVSEFLAPDPFSPNPSGPEVDGHIRLGKVRQSGAPFGLNLDEFVEHTLIAGRAGSGKTTLIYIILIQLIKLGIPFWAFDLKQDYRHLAKSADVIVLDHDSFLFNPLRPPEGVSPKIWMQAFTNIFCQVYWLLSGSKALILAHVDKLYRDYGVFEDKGIYPTMLDLAESLKLHKLERKYGREAGFLESAQNRVSECLLSFSQLLDVDRGFRIEELLTKNVVLEMDGLLAENQTFLLNILLRYVFQYRISNGHRGRLRHIFLFDEAKTVFDKKREFTKELGVSEVAQFTSKIREFGEGLVVADQMPTQLAESIKANVYTVLCLSQSGGPNIAEMSHSLGLTKEQSDELRKLQSDKTSKVFEAIVTMNGRWPNPFVIQILPFQIRKDVTAIDIKSKMAPILKLLNTGVINRTSYQLILDKQKAKESKQAKRQQEIFKEQSTEKIATDENQLIQILTNIKDHPFIEQKSRIEMLHLTGSASTVNNLFKELVDRGFVVSHKIGLGRGKGVRILYEMTEAGMKFARIKPFIIPGRSGFPHKFWQHTIKAFYEKQGLKADIEKRLGLKNVDVCVNDGKIMIAVEVELSPDHLIDNIMKDLDSGCSQVVVCCPNKKMMTNYRKRVKEHDESLLDKIEFRVLTDYI